MRDGGEDILAAEGVRRSGYSARAVPPPPPRAPAALDVVSVRQERQHTQFQHMRAALAIVEERLAQRRVHEERSVWVIFGDDDDLWHPRRVAETVAAIRGHPLLDSVGAFATLGRVNVERAELAPEDELPTTPEEVDEFLASGRATLLADEDPSRAWLQQRRDAGDLAATHPVPETLGLEYFDFCPRLRLVHEFFERTSAAVVANRFCDLCFNEFLQKYPMMGLELGLEVSFFEPASWVYFYAHRGVTPDEWRRALESEAPSAERAEDPLPTSAGVSTGHVSSDVPVGDREVELSKTSLPEFLAYDPSMTAARLARSYAHCRYALEVVLVRTHRQVLDQRELDGTIVDMADHAFARYIERLAGLEDLTSREEGYACMYRHIRAYALDMLVDYDVSVLWHRPERFIPIESVKRSMASYDDGHVSDDEASFEIRAGRAAERSGGRSLETLEGALAKWAGSSMAHALLDGFTVEERLGTRRAMSFRSFSLLLGELGIDLASFVQAFDVADVEGDGDTKLRAILLSCRIRASVVDEHISFPDVFALLEDLGISRRAFVAVFEGGVAPHLAPSAAQRHLGRLLAEHRGRRAGRDDVAAASFDEVLMLLEFLGVALDDFVETCGGVSRVELQGIAFDERRPEERAWQRARAVMRRVAARRLFPNDEETLRYGEVSFVLEQIGIGLHAFISRLAASRPLPQFVIDGFGYEGASRVGRYVLRRVLHEGMTGSSLYLAVDSAQGEEVVLKWPVGCAEAEALHALGEDTPEAHLVGLQRLLDEGEHQGRPYAVTALLGSSLATVFAHLGGHDAGARWEALAVVGRMALSRLEAVHARGIVHCDVSPDNLLVGPGPEPGRPTLYLVDFGCARPWPGGGVAPPEEGSMEFSSIRSSAGCERAPADDVEALAWVLVSGFCGPLPWFEWLTEFYQLKSSLREFKREKLMARVGGAKRQLLDEGWGSFGPAWPRLAEVPAELDAFVRAACAPSAVEEGASERLPCYAQLRRLLGGPEEADEEEDTWRYKVCVEPLM